LSAKHLELFDLYLAELMEWNSRMNLTGLNERGRMISELFLDSMVPVSYLPEKGSMLDVGSGAGFPAIVIKVLLPGLKLHLVDSNSKKASFLKQIIRLLKLNNVEVVNERIEKAGHTLLSDGFDIVSARALANLNQIITWCSSLLSPQGVLVYFSGSKIEDNLKNCGDLLKDHHLGHARSIAYHLPGMKDSRGIILLRKEV
jgi:16S rRNA (guanine527-N7)-methyltransferase